MRKNVLNTLQKYEMLKGVDSVTVALSGGADSVCLLHILNELKAELGLKVYAAHLNHCLRGQDAIDDEMAVKKLCESLNIPLFCERIDVKEAAKKQKQSVETVARNIRYEFLKRVSKGVIATAHTASDNLETVIFNIVRGSGLKGVCGIPVKREGIIRPLIECTREQVEEYCAKNNLVFCTDKTNFQDIYSRNNIRMNVVPKLKEINSAAQQNVSRLSEILSCEEDYISSVATKKYNSLCKNHSLDIIELKKEHKAIAQRVIKIFCEEETNETPEHSHIKEILSGEKSVNLKNNFIARNLENQLIIIKAEKKETKMDYFSFPKVFERINYKNYSFTLKKFEEIVNFNDLPFKNAIDYDTILDTLVLRNRNAGDKITLPKRKVTKTLKKLFTELKSENRDELLVLADGDRVVWVENIGVNSKNQVSEHTKNIVLIEKTGN